MLLYIEKMKTDGFLEISLMYLLPYKGKRMRGREEETERWNGMRVRARERTSYLQVYCLGLIGENVCKPERKVLNG